MFIDYSRPQAQAASTAAQPGALEAAGYSQQMQYRDKITPLLAAARVRAAAAAAERGDTDEAESLLQGHGCYEGSCGHTLQMCRCGKCGGPTVAVDAPCYDCAEKELGETH